MITIITTIEITIFEMRMQFLTDGQLVKGRLKKLKDEIGKFYENLRLHQTCIRKTHLTFEDVEGNSENLIAKRDKKIRKTQTMLPTQ